MCSDPEDPTPSCDGSSLQSTKVGNKVVRGSGLNAGKPKTKKPKGGGGGDKPLLAPNLNTDTLYDLPPLPPHPGECEWTDCILSAASFFASAFTFVPPAAPIAFGVDVVATIWAINRTDRDYNQGKISQTRQRALNITGIIGAIPAAPETGIGIITGVLGTGASFLNLLMTFTGIPK